MIIIPHMIVYFQDSTVMSEQEHVDRISYLLNYGKNYDEAIRHSRYLIQKFPLNDSYHLFLTMSLAGKASTLIMVEQQRKFLVSDMEKYKKNIKKWNEERENPESFWFNKAKPVVPQLRIIDTRSIYKLSPSESDININNLLIESLGITDNLVDSAKVNEKKAEFLVTRAWIKLAFMKYPNLKESEKKRLDYIKDLETICKMDDNGKYLEDVADIYFLSGAFLNGISYTKQNQDRIKKAFDLYLNIAKIADWKKSKYLGIKIISSVNRIKEELNKQNAFDLDQILSKCFKNMDAVSVNNITNCYSKASVMTRLNAYYPDKYSTKKILSCTETSNDGDILYMPEMKFSTIPSLRKIIDCTNYTSIYFFYIDNEVTRFATFFITDKNKLENEKNAISSKISNLYEKVKIKSIIDVFSKPVFLERWKRDFVFKEVLKEYPSNGNDEDEEAENKFEEEMNRRMKPVRSIISKLREECDYWYLTTLPW